MSVSQFVNEILLKPFIYENRETIKKMIIEHRKREEYFEKNGCYTLFHPCLLDAKNDEEREEMLKRIF